MARKTDSQKEYLSISETAALLGVSRPTVYAKIKSGELEVIDFSERIHRIPREQILQLKTGLSPSPQVVRNPASIADTHICKEDILEKYGIGETWFHRKIKGKGIKPLRYGHKFYYPRKEIHNLFHKEQYPQIKEWYNVEELAQRHGVTRKYVRDFAGKHNIPKKKQGTTLLISKKDWDREKTILPDLARNYLTVDQAKKLYHIGQARFYDGVNAHNVPSSRQGREVYYLKSELDKLFKDKSPKIPPEIKRDYLTAKDALEYCHVGQKRFSEETKAAGVTKIRTEGNFVWYKKSELKKLFNL